MIARVSTDRVKQAIDQWRQKEKALVEVFGEGGLTHSEFLCEKLKFYERVYRHYHFGASREEKLTLVFLDSAIDRLRDQVYPFWFDRLLHDLGDLFRFEPLRHEFFPEFNPRRDNDHFINGITHNKPTEVPKLSLKLSDHQKINIMNEQNFSFLKTQLKYTGFGEELQRELRENMQEGKADFNLKHKAKFGEDQTETMLHFKKSDQGDMYFFNRYFVQMQNSKGEDAGTQSFRIARENNITLSEAYNLMNGRAVYKELTSKEGTKYHAWLQLNFKETNEFGDFKMKQFHENYGYNLQDTLAKYPIKEMENEDLRRSLMQSLEKGNREAVTFVTGNQERKMFLEATPQFKSVNVYDEQLKRMNMRDLSEKKSEGQSEAKSKKQLEKLGSDDIDNDGKKGQRKKHRHRQSLS